MDTNTTAKVASEGAGDEEVKSASEQAKETEETMWGEESGMSDDEMKYSIYAVKAVAIPAVIPTRADSVCGVTCKFFNKDMANGCSYGDRCLYVHGLNRRGRKALAARNKARVKSLG